jgi:hypothetical protein
MYAREPQRYKYVLLRTLVWLHLENRSMEFIYYSLFYFNVCVSV